MCELSPVDLLSLPEPIAPEMNLYMFFKGIAGDVTELERVILEFLVAAGTARGWFPTLATVVERFSEEETEEAALEALAGLRRKRLVHLTGDGAVRSIVSGITHQKTPFRALSSENVPFHLVSALDALTIAQTLQKGVHIRTTCPVSGVDIELEVDARGDLVSASPHEVTAFISGWDGEADIPATLAESRFFAGDEMLRFWQNEHGDPEGLPLTQDTIRIVGLEMAGALAALYTRMSIR